MAFSMQPGIEPYDVYRTPADAECDYCREGDDEFVGKAHRHEMFVTRDGAHSYTADELCAVFLEDVAALTTYVVPSDLVMPTSGESFDDGDASQALYDEATTRGEEALGDAGLRVTWDDGYVIERVVAE